MNRDQQQDVDMELGFEIESSLYGEVDKNSDFYTKRLMSEVIDNQVYPRLKYRERYFEPPASPFS